MRENTAFINKNRILKFLLFFLFLFWGELLLCRLGCSALVPSRLTATSASWVQTILPASASQVAGIIGSYHHAQLIFLFLVEAGFYHVGQAGLQLLTLGDLPASASQSAGITGMDHRAQSPSKYIKMNFDVTKWCGFIFHS